MLSTAAFLALATQCATSVHPSTALDVARVESGFHPYAIAEIVPGGKGVISHFPTSLPEAIHLTRQLAAQGRRYSVGLMQITSTNYGFCFSRIKERRNRGRKNEAADRIIFAG